LIFFGGFRFCLFRFLAGAFRLLSENAGKRGCTNQDGQTKYCEQINRSHYSLLHYLLREGISSRLILIQTEKFLRFFGRRMIQNNLKKYSLANPQALCHSHLSFVYFSE
jgi:hypothetical protein